MSHAQDLQRICDDLPNGAEIMSICERIQIQSIKSERAACLYDLGLRRIDIGADTRAAIESARLRILSRGAVEEKT